MLKTLWDVHETASQVTDDLTNREMHSLKDMMIFLPERHIERYMH